MEQEKQRADQRKRRPALPRLDADALHASSDLCSHTTNSKSIQPGKTSTNGIDRYACATLALACDNCPLNVADIDAQSTFGQRKRCQPRPPRHALLHVRPGPRPTLQPSSDHALAPRPLSRMSKQAKAPTAKKKGGGGTDTPAATSPEVSSTSWPCKQGRDVGAAWNASAHVGCVCGFVDGSPRRPLTANDTRQCGCGQ